MASPAVGALWKRGRPLSHRRAARFADHRLDLVVVAVGWGDVNESGCERKVKHTATLDLAMVGKLRTAASSIPWSPP
jgi:hypothetical protein